MRVTLRPVNPADVFSLQGVYPGFRPASMPAVPGLEGEAVLRTISRGRQRSLGACRPGRCSLVPCRRIPGCDSSTGCQVLALAATRSKAFVS